MSKSKAKEYRKWIVIKKGILERAPFCEIADCMNHSIEVHHMRGRVGAMLTDPRYLIAICRRCHDWIHSNMKASRALKLVQ